MKMPYVQIFTQNGVVFCKALAEFSDMGLGNKQN